MRTVDIAVIGGSTGAYCLQMHCTPRDVLDNHLPAFQRLLEANGFQLHWR